MAFNPFKEDGSAMEIAGLKIENRIDQVQIYGEGSIIRDKAGLTEARRLTELLPG